MTTGNGVITQKSSYKDVLDKLLAHGDFTYGKQAELDAAVDKVLNPEKFSYDPVSDPMWGSYQQIYRREGDRAARNALARASVATGGVPSSYAVSAAQQAQNYYNGQMADMLPSLQQNAYQKYLDDYDKSLSGLSTLLSDRDSQYGLWQGGYDKLQSDLAALQAQENAEYQKQQNAYGNLLTLITTTGFVPDANALAAAGMSAEEAAAWKAYYDKANGKSKSGRIYSPTEPEEPEEPEEPTVVSGSAYKQLVQKLNMLVSSADESGNTVSKREISGAIHAAVANGEITQNQAQALLKKYTVKGVS